MAKKHLEVIIFLGTFFYRYLIIFLFLNPVRYLQFMPYQFDIRGLGFMQQSTVFNPEQWGYYYIFLGVFYKFLQVFGLLYERLYALTIFNILLGGLSSVLFFKISLLFVSKKATLILTTVVSVFYPFIYFNALNISENFFIPLLLGIMYLLFTTNKFSWPKYIIIGLVLGVAITIKSLLLPFVIAVAIWILLDKKPLFQKVFGAVTVLFFSLFIIILCAILNQHISQHKQFVLNGTGGVNFAITQCDIKKITYFSNGKSAWLSPPASWNSAQQVVTTNTPFYDNNYYYRMGLSCIFSNPAKLALNFLNLKNIFFGPFYPNFIYSWEHLLLINISYWLVCIFFLLSFGYTFLKKTYIQQRNYLLTIFLILSVFLSIYSSNIGETRYILPYFPFFLLFSSQVVITLYKKLKFYGKQ